MPSFKTLDKLWLVFAPFLVLFLALDQLSKAWALNSVRQGARVDFGFSLSYNDGIAFGVDLPTWLIFILSLCILAWGSYLVVREKLWRDKAHVLGLALVLAGALGNLIDRFRFGHVIDFIKVYWWPTFNLADVWIVVGVILLSCLVIVRGNTLVKA